MKTFAIGLSMAALVLSGGAYAAQGQVKIKGDADGNGVVTRAEAQAQAGAWFARSDANEDGKLDAADRQVRRDARKTTMFERLDANKDGQITKAEFMANKGRDGGRGERGPGKRMAMGEAGTGGMSHGRRGGHDHRGHGRGGMMGARMADADSNGTITQAEFTATALKRFDTMDANKDGQVTQEERSAARAAAKAKWQQMSAQKAQG